MEKIQKNLPLATFILALLILLKSCGADSRIKNVEKENRILTSKVDSLTNIVLTESEMKNVLENTTLWQTLQIEELSDKNKMPINHYKSESQK